MVKIVRMKVRGITPAIADFFKSLGVNVITTGNHIWARKEIYQYLQDNPIFIASC